MSVRDNKLKAVMERQMPFEATAPKLSLPKDEWVKKSVSNCSYQRLLLPQMFDKVERALGELKPTEWSLSVTFDSRYGFVTYYRQENCYQGWSDCLVWYKFDNFRPIY